MAINRKPKRITSLFQSNFSLLLGGRYPPAEPGGLVLGPFAAGDIHQGAQTLMPFSGPPAVTSYAAISMRWKVVVKQCLVALVLVILLGAALVQARPSLSLARTRLYASSNTEIACAAACVVSRRGGLYCPNFLTTPDHWPCVDYKMSWSPCIGWHLEAVFMCR
jgi:hypothetical protein